MFSSRGCDAPLPNEPDLLQGLRETPLLAVLGGKDAAAGKALRAFRKGLAGAGVACKFHVAPQAPVGFLGPPEGKTYAHEAGEGAWLVVCEFLEKHVEDAGPPAPAGAAEAKPVATIADLMQAVNEPAGLRGTLSRALEQKPATGREWNRIRANAALVAEAGGWVEQRTPSRGRPDHLPGAVCSSLLRSARPGTRNIAGQSRSFSGASARSGDSSAISERVRARELVPSGRPPGFGAGPPGLGRPRSLRARCSH